jgi:hypothetical protein
MSLKDKLEIGLKPDAPYRPDNLPDFQADDPACREGATPGESTRVEQAREECDDGSPPRRVAAKLKARRTSTSTRRVPSRRVPKRGRSKGPRTAPRSKNARTRR